MNGTERTAANIAAENRAALSRKNREMAKIISNLVTDTQPYLISAIRRAMEYGGVSNETFGENLKKPTDFTRNEDGSKKPTKYILEYNERQSPELLIDPYSLMDYQAACKYLRYGRKRDIEPEDSKHFYRMYGIKGWKDYGATLDESMKMRNLSSHTSKKSVDDLGDRMRLGCESMRKLTEPIERYYKEHGIVDYYDPEILWEKANRELGELDEQPTVYELARSVLQLARDADDMQDYGQDDSQIRAALDRLGAEVRDGVVYSHPLETRRDLEETLRLMFDENFSGTEEEVSEIVEQVRRRCEERAEDRRRVEEQVIERPLWVPLTAAQLDAAPTIGGSTILFGEGELDLLCDSFLFVADESFFLKEGGRRFVTEHFRRLLKSRGKQLLVDRSTIDALFTRFRATRELTPQEEAILYEGFGEEEIIEARKQLRLEHAQAKDAINGPLRRLYGDKTLNPMTSITDSKSSRENLRYIFESTPNTKFLVFTFDDEFADSLFGLQTRNAVAVKPVIDGLHIHRRRDNPVWNEMLDSAVDELPEPTPEEPLRDDDIRPDERQYMTETRGEGGLTFPAVNTRLLRLRGKPAGGRWSGERVYARYADGSRIPLNVGLEVQAGGEGTVYRIAYPPTLASTKALKIYDAAHLTEGRFDKLSYMLEHDPGIPELSWPEAILYNESGERIGFLMPMMKGEQLALNVLNPGDECEVLKNKGWTRRSLADICANIAGVFGRMHAKRILMGDVNPGNILVDGDCKVYFVDCDSYQVGDFPCQVGVIKYTPPEVHRKFREMGLENYCFIRTEDHERYSLAVLLFEIIMLGQAPYVSKNSTNTDIVDAIIEGAFPYRFNNGAAADASGGGSAADDDSNDETSVNEALAHRHGLKAPNGAGRVVWSHTTYKLKESFYKVFTGGGAVGRPNAERWRVDLSRYSDEIGRGHSTDELLPTEYKIVDADSAEEDECEFCHVRFKRDRASLERRRKSGFGIFCQTHEQVMDTRIHVKCPRCGAEFTTPVGNIWRRSQNGQETYCDSCRSGTHNHAGRDRV